MHYRWFKLRWSNNDEFRPIGAVSTSTWKDNRFPVQFPNVQAFFKFCLKIVTGIHRQTLHCWRTGLSFGCWGRNKLPTPFDIGSGNQLVLCRHRLAPATVNVALRNRRLSWGTHLPLFRMFWRASNRSQDHFVHIYFGLIFNSTKIFYFWHINNKQLAYLVCLSIHRMSYRHSILQQIWKCRKAPAKAVRLCGSFDFRLHEPGTPWKRK